jgi:uncharacterized membrane protein
MMGEPPPEGSSRTIRPRDWGFLLAILLLSAVLRFSHLGRPSLWYDEVITVRLARTPGPSALVHLLDRIDATRAPLHPLLLQAWLKVCGPSDFAGRAFSALCGVLTVFWIGRLAYDAATGLWGAWLAACSPVLIQYSQETRMYEWLVLVTCLAWGLLLSVRGRSGRGVLALYSLVLAALIYSHPLGLIMAATLGLASLVQRSALGLTWTAWLSVYAATALMVVPWLPRYFDHPPEYLIGRLPLRYLLGLPIGIIGGNSLTLLPLAGVVLFGLLGTARDRAGGRWIPIDHPVASTCLLIWFVVPPLVLYVYSWVKHPIFGPSRYTLFVGPAYLLLVARGLVRLPASIRIPLAGAGAALSASLLMTLVYAPGLKTDWRTVAAYLDRHAPGEPVVLCGIPSAKHPSFEAARYYFGNDRRLIPMSTRREDVPTSAWQVIVPAQKGPASHAPEPLPCVEPEGRVVNLAGARLVAPH